MFCVGADAQSFPFAFENRYYPYLYGHETPLNRYAMHYNQRHKRLPERMPKALRFKHITDNDIQGSRFSDF